MNKLGPLALAAHVQLRPRAAGHGACRPGAATAPMSAPGRRSSCSARSSTALPRPAATRPPWKARPPDEALRGPHVTAPEPARVGRGRAIRGRDRRARCALCHRRATRSSMGLNLSVRRGRITGIMGPSGTGKTTLLRLMTAQTAPDQRQVHVFGAGPCRA